MCEKKKIIPIFSKERKKQNANDIEYVYGQNRIIGDNAWGSVKSLSLNSIHGLGGGIFLNCSNLAHQACQKLYR